MNRLSAAWMVPQVEGDFGWHVKAPVAVAGNAMLIAIPAEPVTVSAKNLIPVADYPHLMEDYKWSPSGVLRVAAQAWVVSLWNTGCRNHREVVGNLLLTRNLAIAGKQQ